MFFILLNWNFIDNSMLEFYFYSVTLRKFLSKQIMKACFLHQLIKVAPAMQRTQIIYSNVYNLALMIIRME